MVGDPGASALVGAGFLGFFLAERLLVLHHRDEPEEARRTRASARSAPPGSPCTASSTGSAIGFAFGLDTATGFLVFIAVISHDFADGLNTVSFVLRQGDDRRPRDRWLRRRAAPLVGAIVGTLVNISETPSASCSRSTPASSSSWARPTCCPRRTRTRRGGGSG